MDVPGCRSAWDECGPLPRGARLRSAPNRRPRETPLSPLPRAEKGGGPATVPCVSVAGAPRPFRGPSIQSERREERPGRPASTNARGPGRPLPQPLAGRPQQAPARDGGDWPTESGCPGRAHRTRLRWTSPDALERPRARPRQCSRHWVQPRERRCHGASRPGPECRARHRSGHLPNVDSGW
jgi:hypothetical protein